MTYNKLEYNKVWTAASQEHTTFKLRRQKNITLGQQDTLACLDRLQDTHTCIDSLS